MKEIGLYEAKTHLSRIVAELGETGESVLLTCHGKVVAQISAPPKVGLLKRGCLKSKAFTIADDFDTAEVGFEDVYEAPEMSRVRIGEENSVR